MESEIEKDNQPFWIHHAIDALFHANLAFCLTQGNDYSSGSKAIFWKGLFFVKIIKAVYGIVYFYNKKNCLNITQEFVNGLAVGLCFYGFNEGNLSLNVYVCLGYSFISLVLSLSRSAIFSNVALKGFEVITVCCVRGISYVLRGLMMALFWVKLEGKVIPGLGWLIVLLPFIISCGFLWLLSVGTLIAAFRYRNKDRSNTPRFTISQRNQL